MIHTPETTQGKILVDCMGTEVPGVISFNDETFEVELVLVGRSFKGPVGRLVVCIPQVADLSGCHPVGTFQKLTVKTVIPGAKLVDKVEVQ